jgi:arabinogalactan endo-1,4-beta-galactosidase
MKQLKHLEHIFATYVYSHDTIRNIQMKRFETTSETHLKQNMAPPTAMTYLVGNCDSLQAVLKCSGEGGGRQTSRWAW